jgi:hypothetical protein
MVVNYDILLVALIVIIVLLTLRWFDSKNSGNPEDDCEQKIRELEYRIAWLWAELQKAQARIQELEKGNSIARQPTKPLLLICGPDNHICDSDRHALRRAQISYQRLLEATQERVREELQRKRQDGSLYPWVHVTAHAIEEGIALMDGIAPPGFWNEIFDGVEVVFLAACKSVRVADELAGMVTVVYVHEDIGDRDASAFTYAFWRRMREHGNPKEAYRQAIGEATQVAEFTDIRTR